MIRFKRLTPQLLNAWFVDQGIASAYPPYRLRVWREDAAALAALREEIVSYVEEALDDARKHLREGFEDGLSPFVGATRDPAANYPASLNRVTLQGYLGETLGGIAIEHWGAHGHSDWVVPAYLFRMHTVEFQHLEEIDRALRAGLVYDPDHPSQQRPGRTGDDGLAFRMNADNTITDILTYESKCLTENIADKVKDAHQKLSKAGHCLSGIRELVTLLSHYDTPDAKKWQIALLTLWDGDCRSANRYDGVVYGCGNRPSRPRSRVSWLPPQTAHPDYTANRKLEGFEFHFQNLNTVVDTLYRGA